MKKYIAAGAMMTIFTAAFVEYTAKPPAEPTPQVNDVLERIRQDVGYYEVQAAHWRGDLTPKTPDPAMVIPASDDPPDQAHPKGQHHPARAVVSVCPIANYDVDVSRVELSFRASTVDKKSGEIGLKIPLLGGPGINGSTGNTQAQTIVLHRVVPYDVAILKEYSLTTDYSTLAAGHAAKASGSDRDTEASGVFPISDTLLALRKNLVHASENLPCFDEAKNEPDQDSITLDFQVEHASDKDLGFTFKVLSGQTDAKREDGTVNRITVTFKPHAPPGAKPEQIQTADTQRFRQQ